MKMLSVVEFSILTVSLYISEFFLNYHYEHYITEVKNDLHFLEKTKFV